MRDRFGIETDEQLIEAVNSLEDLDIGIFVMPMKDGVENAS